MNQKEKKELIDNYERTLEKERLGGFRNLDKIRAIFHEIHQLDWADRKYFEDIYHKLNEELFSAGLKLRVYQPERFFNPDKEKPKKTKKEKKNKSNKRKEVFRDLVKSVGNNFDLISRHSFFGVERNDNDDQFKVVLLHDGFSPPNTFVKIQNDINSDCIIKNYKDFKSEINEIAAENLICLFVFNARFEPENSVRELIEEIKGFCDDLYQFKIHDGENMNDDFFNQDKSIENLIEDICYQMSIDLHNLELSYKVIKILKKFFKDNQISSLQYQVLNKGFSGAKVIKVVPISVLPMPQNYVIKIRNKKDSDKLQKEQDAFKKYVEGRGELYECVPISTEECYAIKYRYAATSEASKSFSMGQVVNGKGDWKPEKRIKLIDGLFDEPIFANWGSSKQKAIINYEEFYSSYINLDEIEQQLSKIKALDIGEVSKEQVIKNFNLLKKSSFNSYKKPCHGDLHTENIFVDDLDHISLIDFGDTGIHHALIDHAALEISIKLNHIPNYVENHEIFAIEDELLCLESFEKTFKIKSSKRKDLQSIFEYILRIRNLAKPFMIDPCDYFYSLFMITFRQIRYPTLNQLYAIYSAEQISNYLLKNCFDEKI